MLTDFMPCFIKDYVRKQQIRKRFDRSNCINTTWISKNGVELGKHISLGRDVDVRGGVKIGSYSYCSPGTLLFSKTVIGKYCSIGYRVQIGVPEHPLSFFSTSPQIYKNPRLKKWCDWAEDDVVTPARIGNDVWIGSNAVILQGVTVGDGAVIAAGAIVTKSIPPYTVCGGGAGKAYKI